jgi:YjbE family integral membrane protein
MDGSFMAALSKIIMINIVLSGDNAVVIAMACRNLSPKAQKQGIIWGTVGAVIFRIALTFVAAWLLQFAYLQIVGGLLLFYIAVHLLAEEKEEHVEAQDNLMAAIKTILFADVIMSLDNVLGIAAVAQGNFLLLLIGLAISIPIVVFCSTLILKVMSRFPIITYIGAAILGYVAGEMFVGDKAVVEFMHQHATLHSILPIVLAVLVVVIGVVMKQKGKKEESAEHQPSMTE